MRADHENSRGDRYALKRLLKETLVETDELGDKCHIWVCNGSSLFQIGQALIESHFLFIDKIGQTYGCTTGYTLHTVNIDFTILLSGFFDKLNGIIENAFNLLSNVIL